VSAPTAEEPMAKVIVTAGLVLALTGATISERAQAAAIAPGGFRTASEEFAVVDKVQFVWGGKRYCWYNSGWRGPGWYQCGFRWRRGFGWGGPSGWHGWRRPGVRPPIHRPKPPIANRPGGSRPGGNRPGGTSGNL